MDGDLRTRKEEVVSKDSLVLIARSILLMSKASEPTDCDCPVKVRQFSLSQSVLAGNRFNVLVLLSA